MKSLNTVALLGVYAVFHGRTETATAFVPNTNAGPMNHIIGPVAPSGRMAPISIVSSINRRLAPRCYVANDREIISIQNELRDDSSYDAITSEDPATEVSALTPEQKIINLLFLSAAFGYAIYTILNIDSGMTRGWSASEIAMRIPLDNWGAYESYLANKPIVTKTLINVIIYLLGDWLSQTAFQGKNVLEFDISRTLRNGFIGLCFGPLVHQYYEFSDAILPPENGLLTRLQKIFMDQTIYLTVKCSVYISAVGLLAGEDLATVKQSVKDRIGGVVLTAWKFWPIVHCITYSVIPAQHRILWVNSVDLVWNAILSSAAQKESVFEEGEEESASVGIENTGDVVSIDENMADPSMVLIVSEMDHIDPNNFGSQPNTTSTEEALVVT